MHNILVVYYSRTGTTRKIAEALAIKLNAQTEEIIDTVDRSGAKGYLLSGRDATLRRLTKLEPVKMNSADFDLVIIGTPIWGWNMSVPIRTYLTEQKNNFKNVAFFCTMGGTGDERAFREMGGIIEKSPVATLSLRTGEVVKNDFAEKMEKFVTELMN